MVTLIKIYLGSFSDLVGLKVGPALPRLVMIRNVYYYVYKTQGVMQTTATLKDLTCLGSCD